MRKGNKKEKWDKPKLIILTRGKPEEGVLTICKRPDVGGWSVRWTGNCLGVEISACRFCNALYGS